MKYAKRKSDGTLAIIGEETLIAPSADERASLMAQIKNEPIRDTGCWFMQPDGMAMKLKDIKTGRTAIFKKEANAWRFSNGTYPVEL